MAKKNLYFVISLTTLLFSYSTTFALMGIAPVNDWDIKDFKSEIIVNKDSSLLITEKIIADCDNLPDKHGIFRILPTEIKIAGGETIKTPIQLISITDFNGNKIKYSTINDHIDHTTTWKIGDPNKTVTGANYYKITYKVKNIIRFGNPDFDELYWNLNGNFWDIVTDSFTADIIFPDEVTKENSQVDYYTGLSGSKMKNLARYKWIDDHTLQFYTTQSLGMREGITASITFPKNIFSSYKPNLIEGIGDNFWFFVPIFVFLICFIIWWKYGKDPRINKTIIPEYEIPENLAPIEIGTLITDGKFRNDFVTASILNLAVKGHIIIEEIKKKWFLGSEDFKLKKLKEESDNISPTEQLIKEKIFVGEKNINLIREKIYRGSRTLPSLSQINKSFIESLGTGNEILLSSLKKRFYRNIPAIKKSAISELTKKELVTKKGFFLQTAFGIIAGAALFIIGMIFRLFNIVSITWQLLIGLIISALIITVFSTMMPKRTEKGAELLWKVNGFKLYMETAEKYRQQFYEKENIFEKLLPYAMVFGMTKLWIKKMEQIYGAKYFETYHPVWFVGSNLGTFNVDSFTSTMNGISSSISSSMHSGSGAGGGGFSGGGGGGGGGGGW